MNSELNIDFNRRLEEKRTRKEEKRDEDVAVTVPIPAEMPEPAVPVDARMHVEEVGCAMLTGVKDDLPSRSRQRLRPRISRSYHKLRPGEGCIELPACLPGGGGTFSHTRRVSLCAFDPVRPEVRSPRWSVGTDPIL